MEKYIVLGYEFDDKEAADLAKSEMEMISRIKSQGNMNNHKIALTVYNKLVDDNLFKTQVGLEYMRSLQKELLAAKDIDKNEIKAIRINLVTLLDEKDSSKENNNGIRDYRQNINKNKAEQDAKKYKEQFTKSLIVNLVFAAIIIAMILIVKYSDRFDVQAHRNKIENEYISWESKLQEQESSIQQWENEHGIHKTEENKETK